MFSAILLIIMFSDPTMTTEMMRSSRTWKKIREKTCKVLQVHSHLEGIECVTCQQIDKQTLPNKTLCFVTISANNEYPNVITKCAKNSIEFDVDNQPQDYVSANELNDQTYHFKPFIHEEPISTTPIAIGRPPIPLYNSGNDCYAISGKCYFTNTNITKILIFM